MATKEKHYKKKKRNVDWKKLANLNIRGGPKDLSKNFRKYYVKTILPDND